jgi:biotin carboxyl carrier protein
MQVLNATQQRLELTVSLLSLYEMRLTLQQRQGDLMRLRLAMETTAAVNEQDKFAGAAMAFCNEIASRWDSDRVSLGFLEGRYVHLRAMSHTEKFSRKMKLVQDIEATQEETLDQDVEVLYPAPQGATCVSRAATELSKTQGPTAVLSIPLRRDDQVVAVLTLERPVDEPFGFDEIESLRLTSDLCTPRLVNLHQHDKWFGARAAGTVRKGLAAAVGPKHTWIKMICIGVFALAVFLVFAKGEFRAEAPFVLECTTQQVVPAPFEGFLKQVYVKPGDLVVGGGSDRPNWALKDKDIPDWPGLLAQISAQQQRTGPSAGKRIGAVLAAAGRKGLGAEPAAPTTAPADAHSAALADLNAVLAEPGFYQADAWKGLEPTDRQKDLLELLKNGRIYAPQVVELNRSLLASAYPGLVAPGPTVLGTLETIDMRLELKSSEAERLSYLKQAAAAMREDKRAEAQIAQAQADQVAAKIQLLEYRIAQATLVSPIDGYVVSGDLSRQLGAPVKTGDVLFEVASLVDLRGELQVPEDLVADVQTAYERTRREKKDLTGELATTARPDERIGFTVARINPVAEVVQQNNVFKVRVHLLQMPSIFRPGMEGVGKIDIDRRSFGYIWTRKLINWARMKLWL